MALGGGTYCLADPLLGERRWTLRKSGKNIGSASTYTVDAARRKGMIEITDGELVLTEEGVQVFKALHVQALFRR